MFCQYPCGQRKTPAAKSSKRAGYLGVKLYEPIWMANTKTSQDIGKPDKYIQMAEVQNRVKRWTYLKSLFKQKMTGKVFKPSFPSFTTSLKSPAKFRTVAKTKARKASGFKNPTMPEAKK